MKYIFLICFFLTSLTLFSQSTKDINLDSDFSTKYSETDFNEVKKYFITESYLTKLISKKAKNGERVSIEFMDILTLSYNEAKQKYGENGIENLFSIYDIEKDLIKKVYEANKDVQGEKIELQEKKAEKKNNLL